MKKKGRDREAANYSNGNKMHEDNSSRETVMSTAISVALLNFTFSFAFFCFSQPTWCKTSQPQAKQETAQKLPKYEEKTTSPHLKAGFSFFCSLSVLLFRVALFRFYATTMAPAVRGIVKPGVLILRQFDRINETERSAPLHRLDYNFHQEG